MVDVATLSEGAVRKRLARLRRGLDDERRAASWFRRRRPSNGHLVVPLLKILERRGGGAKPAEIYDELADAIGLPDDVRGVERRFANGRRCNLWERQVRWARETAKRDGLIASPRRGVWSLTAKAERTLGLAKAGVAVTVFVTDFGRAVWAEAERMVGMIEPESLDLIFTSLPYPLLEDKRQYGRMAVADWLEWMSGLASAWHALLKPTGSLIVNLGPVGVSGLPVQSPYIERFTLTLVDDLQYWLYDRLYWHNPTRMPPMEWVAKRRRRLKPSVEPLLWFSPRPFPKADNRRVLEPYADKDRWIGKTTATVRPSGFDLSARSFARDNGGRIPSTLITTANAASHCSYRESCRRDDVEQHPAVMPARLAEIAIAMATEPGDLVYDPFLGSGTTGAVAEHLGRRWIGSDRARSFLQTARYRFAEARAPGIAP